jgi:hypothetical protein
MSKKERGMIGNHENGKSGLGLALTGALLAACAAGGALAQTGYALSGKVTDANGAALKDAKVILLGRNLTVRTDAAGAYSFADVSTGIGAGAIRGESAAAEAVPRIEGGSLRFAIREGSARVRISLFTLSGSLVREVADARLVSGEYQANPFRPGMIQGAYVVRMRIGASLHELAVPYVNGPGAAGSRLIRTGAASEPAGRELRKTAAAMDTLSVVALGFERGERLVETLSGTQDFKLSPVKFANLPYKTGANLSAAEKSACILDIRTPKSGTRRPVLIQLHGGGMTGGDRNEPYSTQYANFGQKFLDAGVIMVTPGYRLIGAGTWPDYIRDAAAAAIWVRRNIEPYGGDPNSVFISGFSAGAYLTSMLAIDSTWFGEAEFDVRNIAGFISNSGQTRQHENIRNDLKVSNIMVEKPYAMPMGHIRKTDIPWQIFVGGNEGGTTTDNKAMYDALIKAGSTNLYYDVIPNLGHTVADMGAATSVRRDKFLAFIARYRAK